MTTLIDIERTTKRPLGAVSLLQPGRHAAVLPLGSQRPLGTVAPLGAGTAESRPAHCTAPARFDVHQVETFEQWAAAAVDAGASKLVVDCTMIDFVDLAALESVDRLRASHDVELVDLSLATLITLQLLGATDSVAELAEAA